MKRIVTKYLENYAEPILQQLLPLPQKHFQHCLTIPCYDENPLFIDGVTLSLANEENVLIILVVNQPISVTHEVQRNLDVFEYFSKNYQAIWSNQQLSLFQSKTSSLSWLVANFCQPDHRLPDKQGVGLARKIAGDLAVALFAKGYLKIDWIHCTDADTHLPSNYFNLPSPENTHYSAAVYNFQHRCDSGNIQEPIFAATLLYEQALKYYVAGLTWAGSPYNHHSIGSTIAVNVISYCQVRGFPKRSGGEDFYLLNKCLKVAPICRANDITLEINARFSHRVPFGTGPTVKKIMLMANPDEEYTYYAPETFYALKQWLDIIPDIWNRLQHQQDPLKGLTETIQIVLKEAGVGQLWNHIRRHVSQKSCIKAIHDWFDAFQTLKFIRRMQHLEHPAIPLKECIRTAPFNS